jgi:hypothetical protein
LSGMCHNAEQGMRDPSMEMSSTLPARHDATTCLAASRASRLDVRYRLAGSCDQRVNHAYYNGRAPLHSATHNNLHHHPQNTMHQPVPHFVYLEVVAHGRIRRRVEIVAVHEAALFAPLLGQLALETVWCR